jgi:hypothetical protein
MLADELPMKRYLLILLLLLAPVAAWTQTVQPLTPDWSCDSNSAILCGPTSIGPTFTLPTPEVDKDGGISINIGSTIGSLTIDAAWMREHLPEIEANLNGATALDHAEKICEKHIDPNASFYRSAGVSYYKLWSKACTAIDAKRAAQAAAQDKADLDFVKRVAGEK